MSSLEWGGSSDFNLPILADCDVEVVEEEGAEEEEEVITIDSDSDVEEVEAVEATTSFDSAIRSNNDGPGPRVERFDELEERVVINDKEGLLCGDSYSVSIWNGEGTRRGRHSFIPSATSSSTKGTGQSDSDDDIQIIDEIPVATTEIEIKEDAVVRKTSVPKRTNVQKYNQNFLIIQTASFLKDNHELTGRVHKPQIPNRTTAISTLDIFRCYICGCDFETSDEFKTHRIKMHPSKKYDSEVEKPFACGICGQPWHQPRKALACAVYGHDPAQIITAMFCHNCPICPEGSVGYHSLQAVARHWSKSHLEPIPQFFFNSQHKDILPKIKIGDRELMNVSLSMLNVGDTSLVLDNIPRSGDIPHLFRCAKCKLFFPSRKLGRNHSCIGASRIRKPVEKQSCLFCNTRFSTPNCLKAHLKISPCTFKEDVFLYKCVICGLRLKSFKELKSHRNFDHADVRVKFNYRNELPFACYICGKPTLNQKEALICALLGHKPDALREASLTYRCTYCPRDAFGFHSEIYLRIHLEEKHEYPVMPEHLKKALIYKNPLPVVKISLNELLQIKYNSKHLAQYVTELEPPAHLTQFVSRNLCPSSIITSNANDTYQLRILEEESFTVAFNNNLNNAIFVEVKDICKETQNLNMKPLTAECKICFQSFKNLQKHMKIHDLKRYDGVPKFKCYFCNRAYHIRSSFTCHRLRSNTCKDLYLKYRDVIISKQQQKKLNAIAEFKDYGGPRQIVSEQEMERQTEDASDRQIVIKSVSSLRVNPEISVKKEKYVVEEADNSDNNMIEVSDVTRVVVKVEPEDHNPGIVQYDDVDDHSHALVIKSIRVKESTPNSCDNKMYYVEASLDGLETDYKADDDTEVEYESFASNSAMYAQESRDHEIEVHTEKENEEIAESLVAKSSVEDIHECPLCMKVFYHPYNLNRHMKLHMKPTVLHSCNVCHKSYNYIWNLKRHQRMKKHFKSKGATLKSKVNTKINVYECLLCNKRFSNGSNLNRHSKLHTNTAATSSPKMPKLRKPDKISLTKSPPVNIRDKSAIEKILGSKSIRVDLQKIDPEMPVLEAFDE